MKPCQTKTLPRNLFHDLRVPALLTFLGLALVLTLITSTAMADPRYKNNGPRFSTSFNSSFNRNINRNISRDFRHNVNRQRSWNSGWNRDWNSHYSNRSFNNRFYDNRSRYRNNSSFRNSDNWSVSLNFGTGVSSWYNSSFYNRSFYNTSIYNRGIYTGIGSQYYPQRNTTIIYNQPDVVYVNKTLPVSGRGSKQVISTGSTSRAGQRDLLRDINGDCFERVYDSQGRQTRYPLPDSACNF